MEKIRYRLVYDRKHLARKAGSALVQLEARQSGRKAYFSTGVYIPPACWDVRKAQAVGMPGGQDINIFLNAFMLQVKQAQLALWKSGVEFTLPMLREHVRARRLADALEFVPFSVETVSNSARRTSTKQNMMATIRKIQEISPHVTFRDLTPDFLRRFADHLRKLGQRTNTVAKHMRSLRTLVGEAIRKGYMREENNPFRQYVIHEERSTRRDVSTSELRRLSAAVLPHRLAHVRDAFLFCCYTGMRFSDFSALRSSQFSTARGKTWLSFTTQKTSTPVRLPVSSLFSGKALAILSSYPSPEAFARVGRNSTVNKALKEVFAAAGIKDATNLSFHSSRHTFASLLASAKVSMPVVQRLLGHTSMRTTQGYSHISDSAVEKEVAGMKAGF